MTRRYALRDGFGDFRVAHLRHSRWTVYGNGSSKPWRSRGRQRVRDDRLDHRASAPARCWDKRGGAASHRTQPQRAERQDSRGGGCTGLPDFISRQGRRTASKEADVLLAQTAAETVIADKGYDAQARVLEPLPAQGKGVVIASRFDECRPRTS